jgi:hypothetical protein
MKKLYSLLAVTLFTAGTISAQCTIDVNNTSFFTPQYDSVPCAERNVAYDQTLQFRIPTQVDLADYGVPISYILNCDSVVLDSITGLPAGLNWVSNPAGPVFYPGTNGCGRTTGTTTVSAGNYPLVFHGLIYLSGNPFPGFFDGDTSITIQQFLQANQGGTYSIDVIEQGTLCNATAINNFSNELNTMISVYPNPSNGLFEFNMNSGRRITGSLTVVDITGKTVFTQNIDVVGLYNTQINLADMPKGLYTLQLKTAEGFASKYISIQ